MTGPADGTPDRTAGHGHLRASRADREQATEVLKTAFVQERLTKDELDTRIGQALAARTYAELNALTADIPGGLPRRQPREPGRAGDRPSMGNARKAAICVAVAIVVPAVLAAPTGGFALAVCVRFYCMALLIAGAQALATRYEKRAHGQLPPGPGHGRQVGEGPQPGQAGDGQDGNNPALPETRPGQDRTDLQRHSSRADRPCPCAKDAWALRGIRPVPGVA